MTNDLRILHVQYDSFASSLTDLLSEELSCYVDHRVSALEFIDSGDNILDYNVLLIDASDDYPISYPDRFGKNFSEWAKEQNPNIINIGMSICGYYFDTDELSRQLYDEKIIPEINIDNSLQKKVKRILETKYGFEFPQGAEK